MWLQIAGHSNEQTQARVPAARFARGLHEHCPSRKEGAGNAGCALHPRSRVQNAQRKSAHEHTGSAEAIRHSLRNGFTAYAVLSPATNSSCHRRCRLMAGPIRLDRYRHRQLGTSNGCRDHTVLPYASAPFVLRAVSAHGSRSAQRTLLAPDAAASTASRPNVRDDGQRPSCGDRMERAGRTDLPDKNSKIFLRRRLDRSLMICPTTAVL